MSNMESEYIKPKVVVGIDPGISTGFAVWDSEKREFTVLKTLDFWKVIDRLKLLHFNHGKELLVVIEDPNGNKPVFMKKGVKSNAMAIRVGQNVGSNKREASLLIEYCRNKGINVKPVIPGKKATGKGKITKEYFNKISGYTGSTSQHGRDAAMMILGM
jgi:hypothetical protein